MSTGPMGAGSSLTDTHAHLDGYGGELRSVLGRAWQAGVRRIVAVGGDLESSAWSLELCWAVSRGRALPDSGQRSPRASAGTGPDSEPLPRLAAVVGIHPHLATATRESLPRLRELLAQARERGVPAAVGETGLDYFRDLSPRADQRASFWSHVELAHECALPLVVHDREAHQDVLAILRAGGPFPRGGVMHCFSGDLALAQECIALGLHVSFAGPLTFPGAGRLRDVAAALPADRLLVETDCPFLAPVPLRGRRNEPAHVVHVARALAALRRTPEESVFRTLEANAAAVFFPSATVPPIGPTRLKPAAQLEGGPARGQK